MKKLFLGVILCLFQFSVMAQKDQIIAFSADGSEVKYELQAIHKVTFLTSDDHASMQLHSQSSALGSPSIQKIQFTTKGTRLEETASLSLSLYPNPVRDYFRIDGAKQGATIQILDLCGHVVYQSTMIEDNQLIEVGQLLAGTYIVRVDHHIIKFIKY